MGSGLSAAVNQNDTLEGNNRIENVQIMVIHSIEKNSSSIWKTVNLEVSRGFIYVEDDDKIENISLLAKAEVDVEEVKSQDGNYFVVHLIQPNLVLRIKSSSNDLAHARMELLRREILSRIMNDFHQDHLSDQADSVVDDSLQEYSNLSNASKLSISPPKMNIVILVVGTRGDVQPFVYLGQALKRDGHRVRLATHAEYREDVVAKGGLEFFPLGGDPRKLSEFMVKTEGRLIPDLTSSEERKDLPMKMKMLREICVSTFPACTQPDPEDAKQTPFSADAIISNPVTYGHIHCAEALAVPLHIMFPQPWSPTKCFPHPLSNLALTSRWSRRNYYSFKMVDEIMWMGLGSIINDFRRQVLKIHPIRPGEHGDSLLNDNKVPISHMWSPSFVPKCVDWPEYVDVVGEFRSMSGAPSTFVPPAALVEFLEAGEKPLYMGFGSMVIGDPSRLVNLVRDAADKIGCRLLLQSGWTKYGEDNSLISNRVMVIGAMPHDWLLYQVSGVVHHGGAGTTSAGLRAGNPTFVCPFFGDQHFWAEMVNRAGVGPKGCPIVDLTLEKLIEALQTLRDPETIKRARDLGEKMNSEDGVAQGVDSFYRNLPLSNMLCEVSVFDNQTARLASSFCPACGLKMSDLVDKLIHRRGSGRHSHNRIPFRPMKYGVLDPHSILEGLGQGWGVAAYEVSGGVYDLFAKPIEGAMEKGVTGAAVGIAHGVKNLFARPIKGGKILVHRVVSGATAEISPRSQLVEAKLAEHRASYSNNGDEPDDQQLSITAKAPGKDDENDRIAAAEKAGAVEDSDDESDSPEEGREQPGEGTREQIEEAYRRALNFLELWKSIDVNGDRSVLESELRAVMNSNDAKNFMEHADDDNDNTLTFIEFAWKFGYKNF